MTDSTIFSDDKQSSQQSSTQTGTRQEPDLTSVTTLVGEGKKYKTIEDLAKAYVHADAHIEQLIEENREFKAKLAESKTVEDVLNRIEQERAGASGSQTTKTGQQNAAVSASEIANIVRQTVTGLETERTKATNLQKADKLLKEALGNEGAVKAFQEVANTPELKAAYMNLAAVDPDKFVALFKTGSASQKSTSADSSGQSTSGLKGSLSGDRVAVEGTREWASEIRKKNPAKYYSQEFQLQLDKYVREDPKRYWGA